MTSGVLAVEHIRAHTMLCSSLNLVTNHKSVPASVRNRTPGPHLQSNTYPTALNRDPCLTQVRTVLMPALAVGKNRKYGGTIFLGGQSGLLDQGYPKSRNTTLDPFKLT